jgi:hypothetical protein
MAQLDGIMWNFYRDFIAAWRDRNPDGTVDDLLAEFERRTASANATLIGSEMAAGYSKEEATYIAENLGSHRAAAEGMLDS